MSKDKREPDEEITEVERLIRQTRKYLQSKPAPPMGFFFEGYLAPIIKAMEKETIGVLEDHEERLEGVERAVDDELLEDGKDLVVLLGAFVGELMKAAGYTDPKAKKLTEACPPDIRAMYTPVEERMQEWLERYAATDFSEEEEEEEEEDDDEPRDVVRGAVLEVADAPINPAAVAEEAPASVLEPE